MAAMPPAIMTEGGWRVLAIFTESGDRITELLFRGNELGACHHAAEERPPEPYVITNLLDGTPTAACRRTAGGYLVYTENREYTITVDGGGMLRAIIAIDSNDYPTPTIAVVSESLASFPVEECSLSGEYNARSTSLEARDVTRVSSALADAYCQASNDCSATGSLVAPILSRYRLYDRLGNMLFESVPKLHVPTGRHDENLAVTMDIDGSFSHLLGGYLALPNYKLGVIMPPRTNTVAAGMVARMEVQLTPQLHRVDAGLTATSRLFSPTPGALSLSATVPSLRRDSPGYRNMITKAVAASDDLFETVLEITDPFGGVKAGTTVALQPAGKTVAAEKAILAKARGTSSTGWVSRCRLPHRLSAGVATDHGDIKLLGDLRIHLYSGHPAHYYMNSGNISDDIESVAVVTFGNDRRTVTRNSGRLWRDMTLSPLIAYPDPDATGIEITVRDTAGVHGTLSLPLSRCGRWAIYVAPELRPVVLPDYSTASTLPSIGEINPTVQYPGRLLLFSGDKPGDGTHGVEINDGEIKVLHRVDRSTSSTWELSRTRYLVMGTGGIYTLTVSGSTPGMPVLLDSRGVKSSAAVAAITRLGDSSRVCAIASGDLVAIDINRVITLSRRIGASMLAWCGHRAELLAISEPQGDIEGSRALVMHADSGGWSVHTLPAITSTYNHPLMSRLVGSDTIYDLTREVDTRVHCRYSRRVGNAPGAPHGVFLSLTGSNIQGSLRLTADNGRLPAVTISTLWLDGDLDAPLVHRYISRPRVRLTATLEATLSPDGRLTYYP